MSISNSIEETVERVTFEKPTHFAWHLYPLLILAAILAGIGIGLIKEGLYYYTSERILYVIMGFFYLIFGGSLLLYLKSLRSSVNAGYLLDSKLPLLEPSAYLFIAFVVLCIVGTPILFAVLYIRGKLGESINWSNFLPAGSYIKLIILTVLARSAWVLIKTRKSLPSRPEK